MIECDHCSNNFMIHESNFYYWKLFKNNKISISGICNNCYTDINSNLKVLVDDTKIAGIKRKAKKLMLERKICV